MVDINGIAIRKCDEGGDDGNQRHRAYLSDGVELRTLPRILPQAAAVSRAETGDRYRNDVLLRRRPHRGRDQRAVAGACRRRVRAKTRRPASSVLSRPRARRHRRTAHLPEFARQPRSSARRARINGRRDTIRSCSRIPMASGSSSIMCRARGCWASSRSHSVQRKNQTASVDCRALSLRAPCGMIATTKNQAAGNATNKGAFIT